MRPRFNYDDAAANYDRHRTGQGPYIPELIRIARSVDARRVIELGAGTGNPARHFTNAYPCAHTCIEFSTKMLAEGQAKGLPTRWLRGDAQHLPFAASSADFVYAVMMIQHVPNLVQMIEECARVAAGGVCAFVTIGHDAIKSHPMTRYFPSFADADLERFPSEPHVMDLMCDTGFTDVSAVPVRKQPIPVDAAYLERVRNKFISTFEILPPGEFETGLAAFEQDIEAHGVVGDPFVWEAVVISGRCAVQ